MLWCSNEHILFLSDSLNWTNKNVHTDVFYVTVSLWSLADQTALIAPLNQSNGSTIWPGLGSTCLLSGYYSGTASCLLQTHRSGSRRDDGAGLWSLIPLTPDLNLCSHFWFGTKGLCLIVCVGEFLPQVSIMCIIFCTSTCADWILNNSVDGHKVWSQFYVFQRMNPHHFVVFKIFHDSPPLGQLSNILWTLAQHLHDGFAPLVDFGSPSLHLCRLLYMVDMWKIFCQILKGFL